MAFSLHCLRALPVELWKLQKKAKKLAKDDPRRVIHSMKVGLALVLISLYYNFQPFYDGFGVDAMWAVLTVVLVFEFSVGATMGKLINRIAASLLAGALGVGAHTLATSSGEIGKPILLTFFVFLVGSIVTFMRFYPGIKARYDYGLMIFVLTFCLVTVSGYREIDIWKTAHKSFSTVVIGSFTAITVCLCICPVWVGADLHNLVSNNIEKLDDFLEGFGGEYFATMEDGQKSDADKLFLEGYKSVLASKTTEETMVNLARWEPRHGRFKFRHPWDEYVKIGTLSRQCAYKLEAINCYLKSDTQTPAEVKSQMREPCIIICSESGKILKELVRTMRRGNNFYPCNSSSQCNVLKTAAENLKSLLKGRSWWEEAAVLEIIPAVAIASQLIEIVTCVDKITMAVHELASLKTCESKDFVATSTPEQPRSTIHDGANGSNRAVITISD